MYKDYGSTNIANQLRVIKNFPSFLSKEEGSFFTSEVSLGEVEGDLKSFKKDKSPRPNGWSA